MNHTQNTDNLDIEYDYDETEDCHNYAHNNWYDEDEEYEDDEDKGTASALHRFAPDFIHSDADLLEEYKKCNIPNRYQYTPPEDDDCYIINNSRNLTVHLDDPSNIEPLQKFIDCFQESADEEEERHNQTGIAVAQEFDQHSIHRRIIVDSSINLTIDLRKHSASNFVDTCLADDDDDEE